MSVFKLKRVVIFVKLIIHLLLLRSFGNDCTKKQCYFSMDHCQVDFWQILGEWLRIQIPLGENVPDLESMKVRDPTFSGLYKKCI